MTLARGTTQAARFRSRIKPNTDPAGMLSLAAILRPDKPRQRPRARAWDGTDLRRRCSGIKTIDEIVRPNNRRGVDDQRRLCFSSFARLDNLTVYSGGILPLFRGGRFCWLSAARTSLYSTFVRVLGYKQFRSSAAAGVLLLPGATPIHSIIVT